MSELLSGLNGGNVPALDLIILLTAVALLPSIVIMMTSFLRIVIVLSFTRNAIGVQQTPPNVVLTGISLFLTLYIMAPVISDINTNAYQAYIQEFPIVKDTTPNMMNPRLYTTSYNKPQGQQFDDTAVLSFIKLQYT